MGSDHFKGVLIGCFIFLIFLQFSNAQNATESTMTSPDKKHHWSVNGYLKDLQSIQFTDINQKWTLDNLVHNRVDVNWYADNIWKFHLGVRNRLFYGESTAIYEQNKSLLEGVNNFFDLSKILTKGESYLLHSTIDRASLDFALGKWQITAGRQRINWGLNLVWNPNDIFNAYSYFDFDYEERPGTDAVRIQYYVNSTSSVELAYKPGKYANETVVAGLYRFSKGSYDVQFLAGLMNTDYVLGGGWSGVLGRAGFNGEITTFVPTENSPTAQTVISTSLGINYTFPKSLYLHGAYLFNSGGMSQVNGLSFNLLLNNVTAKSLSPSRHSFLGEGAYQFTPLIRGNISGIIDATDGSFFAGPFVTFSLANSVELLIGGQLFFGKENSLYGNYGKIIFIRLKWSF